MPQTDDGRGYGGSHVDVAVFTLYAEMNEYRTKKLNKRLLGHMRRDSSIPSLIPSRIPSLQYRLKLKTNYVTRACKG